MITFNNNEDYLRNLSSNKKPDTGKGYQNSILSKELQKEDIYSSNQKLFYSNGSKLSDNFSEISPITSSEKKQKLTKLNIYDNESGIKSLNDEFYQRQQTIDKNIQNIERQADQKVLNIARYESKYDRDPESLFELNASEICESKLIQKLNKNWSNIIISFKQIFIT